MLFPLYHSSAFVEIDLYLFLELKTPIPAIKQTRALGVESKQVKNDLNTVDRKKLTFNFLLSLFFPSSV